MRQILHAVVRGGDSSISAAEAAVWACIDSLRDERRAQPNALDDELSDHLEEAMELVGTPVSA